LKGERKGQWSIGVNDQWRICFEWVDGGATNVEIVDYH
jgi:toxin HigB-1